MWLGDVLACMTFEEPVDVPNSLEVRFARLETRVEDLLNRHEAIVEAYAPTNRQVIENGLRIAEIREDLIDFRQIIKERDQRVSALEQKLEKEILACSAGVGDLESRLRKERDDREKAEKLERERREEKERDDRRTRNRWAIGIIAGGFISAFCVYLGSVLPT